ncbi:alpha/beta hydrolase [Georgenia halophila]|uniref:Alpha/beta hydrolase n=1 Tax=Georgenia halophila TaxID=620889 RepID=A0ABP8KTX7_9MICO
MSLETFGPSDGLPLVLLHAFPLDSRMWQDVISELDDIRVVTLDAPGFGDSPSPRELADELGCPVAPSLKTYAEAIALTLTDAGVDRAVVAGLSMGGYAALEVAERHPGLLAGIGLLDTKAGTDGPEARANRIRVADQAVGAMGSRAVAPMVDAVLSPRTHRERPDVVATVRDWLATAPPNGVSWAQRAMAARPDRLAVLERLEVPGLVLRGTDDASSSMDDAEAMEHALHDGELVVVPRAGHLSAVEEPREVATALRSLYMRCR